MKKILSIILCLALVLSLTVMASATEIATGEYAIVAEHNGVYYAMTAEQNAKANKYIAVEVGVENGVVVTGNPAAWNVTAVDGGITISNSQGYVTYGSGTNITYGADAYTWRISDQADGTMWLLSATKDDRALSLRNYENNGSLEIIFGGYSTSNATNDNAAQYSIDVMVLPISDNLVPDAPGGDTDVDEPVVAPTDPKEIVDAAFALEVGASLPYECTLTGPIVTIDTAYSEQFGNITVSIEVEGTTGKQVLKCYRLKGEGAENLAVGDTITVTGNIKNYNGTVEFDSGCTVSNIVKGEAPAPVVPTDPKEIVDAAFALEVGASLPYEVTLTGPIVSIDTEYSEQHGNITVSIEVEGTTGKQILQCFRLKGEGAENLAVGDVITVTGNIINYNGKIEFNSGCTFVAATTEQPPVDEPVVPEGPSETGDMIGVVVALLAVSGMAITVVSKKQF